MKKATTIIRLIDNLEKELYSNYSREEIYDAIVKEEKKSPFFGVCDGLISVLYSNNE